MAVTIRNTVKRRTKSDLLFSVTELDLGFYTTGGVAVSPKQLGGMNFIYDAVVTVSTPGAATAFRYYVYDPASQKIKAYESPSGSESTNGTGMGAIRLKVFAFGG